MFSAHTTFTLYMQLLLLLIISQDAMGCACSDLAASCLELLKTEMFSFA
jgi:hypothetical protein